ncbi:ABC-2 type transport system permease protein [Tistlia consotensis]|uniref:Transport permease protein n=1 Tax=Tistlia consotensis USBA 355 TaxID=560819 RepID=A0A1Y6BL76_9PROT|nr:ABC transporter permease [Tistlia consotensis]SMF06872.1 ABC-2 type transport system permease protein [Tistlia consotensis USBA 355]SNR36248.1 ABC-2 type transport system permease protein [Tistlia consotensis]
MATTESDLGAARRRPLAGAALQPRRSHPGPRNLGRVNWRGLWTLYLREVKRFLNVFTQTILAPMVTSLLFLAIFTLALGRGNIKFGDVPYAVFLAPGLIMMQIIQQAFANTSSSILISKVQGNIVDVLMPPLSHFELALGFAAGGVTRGLSVALAAGIAMAIFLPIGIHDPLAVVWFAVNASLMLALLGMIGGIWAEKFDHIAAITNFVIMPLSFLSGTFYSIKRLPDGWNLVAHLDPFFYLIDGFRYGFLGHHDGNLAVGAVAVAGLNVALWLVVQRMFATGYKLKP